MYLTDYHTHPFAHGNTTYNLELLKRFIEKAKKMNLNELGFSDHDIFFENILWEKLLKLKQSKNLKIKIGLEVDYTPGQEDKIREMLNKLPLDYCIGSVHQLGDWTIDHPDYKDEYQKRNIDNVYKKYFNILNQAVKSGLFDIIGHLDLVKVFNFKPVKLSVKELVVPVLKSIKKRELSIEINTNGLNKPVKEIYPALNIIKKAYNYKIPICTGSDAHRVERVGEGIQDVYNIIKEVGYKKIMTYSARKGILKDI